VIVCTEIPGQRAARAQGRALLHCAEKRRNGSAVFEFDFVRDMDGINVDFDHAFESDVLSDCMRHEGSRRELDYL